MKLVAPKLIGLTGLIGAGKNTFADALCEVHPAYQQMAFSYKLKRVTEVAYGWPLDLLRGETALSRAWRDKICPAWGVTPRSALQMVGVQFRDLDQDFWVKNTLTDTTLTTPTIVTDVRFPNEFKAIRDLGGVIVRITREVTAPEWWTDAVTLNNQMAYGRKTDMNKLQASNYAVKLNGLTAQFEVKYPDIHISEWASAGEAVDFRVTNPRSPEIDLKPQAIEMLKYLSKPEAPEPEDIPEFV